MKLVQFEQPNAMKDPKTIPCLFMLPGFLASSKLVGVFGDRYARLIKLRRRKNRCNLGLVEGLNNKIRVL